MEDDGEWYLTPRRADHCKVRRCKLTLALAPHGYVNKHDLLTNRQQAQLVTDCSSDIQNFQILYYMALPHPTFMNFKWYKTL